MKLIYNNKDIDVTFTHNQLIMRNKVMKLYYAYYIIDCNRYSSIKNRYNVDVIMVDKDNIIVSYQKDMHINTVHSHKKAKNCIITPVEYFDNIKKGEKIIIEGDDNVL